MTKRTCPQCGHPFEKRRNAKFCSDRCKTAHWKERNGYRDPRRSTRRRRRRVHGRRGVAIPKRRMVEVLAAHLHRIAVAHGDRTHDKAYWYAYAEGIVFDAEDAGRARIAIQALDRGVARRLGKG